MLYHSLKTYIKNAVKVAILLVFVMLRHPTYKAQRNHVGNFIARNKDGNPRGYFDFYYGEVVIW